MTPTIHILDQHSANQIAAGEVVERPVSVVKELIENSLDAGAHRIDVSVEGNGVPLLRVRDDGIGISAQDLSVAVLRHATSKIRSIEDLNTLGTLGFRGEALPSIVSVSRLEIISRSAEAIAGMSLVMEGGRQVSLQEIGCAVGTTVTVENLFYNTPARQKFLRTANTEFGLISDTLGRLALARPDVAFSLSHPHQVVLQTPGHGKLLESIGAVLGNDIARRLLPVSFQNSAWSLEGYISPPDLVRSTRQTVTFILNGRYIRSTLLARALQEGYHTLIPAKLHPITVLHLQLPPLEYDVNVHPTKMDVRFAKEKELSDFISTGIHSALIKKGSLPSLGSTRFSEISRGKPFAFESQKTGAQGKAVESERSSSAYRSEVERNRAPGYLETEQRVDSDMRLQESIWRTPPTLPLEASVGNLLINSPPVKEDSLSMHIDMDNEQPDLFSNELASPNSGFNFWPLAQLFDTYILATEGRVLVLIDQHAAHERINYERLWHETQQREMISQALLIPITMELTLQEEQAVLEHLWALHKIGFILEHFGSRTYLLRAIPAQIGTFQGEEVLRQFIEEVLQDSVAPTYEQLFAKWIYLLACKESIKAKENLSLLEMEQLLVQLARTENPFTCPHGRPTMIQISRDELEKKFYRK
ncbi:MAG: DNA mismatch repair endonuclease MutL [Desulfitobacteriaceae bacterium]